MTPNYARVKSWRKRHPDIYAAQKKRRSLRPHRKKSHVRKVLIQQQSYQKETEKGATNVGKGNTRSWTDKEDAMVMDYSKTARELAINLKRTFWSITNRRFQISKNHCL